MGRPVTSLRDFESRPNSGNTTSPNGGRTPRNLTRTLVDTAMSRFAKTETRAQFVTSGGTPAQQARSETCTDAANALIEQVEGERVLRRAALHACVFDLGVAKVIDSDDGPSVEHVPSWEWMFEPVDAHRGKPTIAVQKFNGDKDALIADFAAPPEDEEETEVERIERAQLVDDIRSSSSSGLTTADHTMTEQHCVVFELWRLPVGRSKGRHVICTDSALLLDEQWTEKKFPAILFGWSAPLFGAYPTSIAAINCATQDELDGLAIRISQILRKMAVPIWVESGATPDGTTPPQIRGGGDAIGDIVRAAPGTQLTKQSADGNVGAELFKQEDRVWQRGFETTGINENSANGTRPAGLNSAPAQREWNEINQDRLSLVALDYQQAHVDLATILLSSIARIPEYEITVKNPNGRWMRKVKSKDLNLDESDYVIQKFPISALPNTPSGRLAAAADLLQMGAIEKEDFMEIVQLPDLKSKLDIHLQSRRATEKLIAKMLERRKFEAPSDMLDLKYALKYATTKYLEGLADDMPDEQLAMLKDWIDNVIALQKAATPPAAPMNMAGTSLAPLPVAPLAPPVSAQSLGASMAGAA